jgi:ribosomal protein S2
MKNSKHYTIADLNFWSLYSFLCGKCIEETSCGARYRKKEFTQFIAPNTLQSLVRAIKFLRLFSQGSPKKLKILFLGTPVGLKGPFRALCKSFGCSTISAWSPGLVSNYNLDKKVFTMIVVFDSKLLKEGYKELYGVRIPILSFVTHEHPAIFVEYPVYLHLDSVKGGVFGYNLFYSIFKNLEENQKSLKIQLPFKSKPTKSSAVHRDNQSRQKGQGSEFKGSKFSQRKAVVKTDSLHHNTRQHVYGVVKNSIIYGSQKSAPVG